MARGGSRRPAHVLLDALLLAGVAGIVVVALIAALALPAPAMLISDQLRLSILLLAPAVLGQVAADLALSTTRWTHHMRYEVIARGAVEPYVATGAALAAWVLGFHATGLLIGYWAGTAALVLFALFGARRCLGGLSLRHWRPSVRALTQRFRRLLPATGSDICASLADRLDLYLVGLLLGDAPAGIYGVVRELRLSVQHVRQAFDSILIPVVARTLRADGDVAAGEAVSAAMRLILSLQLVLVLLLAAAGEWLLGLFGAQYVAGYPALLVMLAAQMVASGLGVSELILYFRRPALALVNNLLTIAVMALLIPLLAPRLGLIGAGLALFVAAVAGAVARRQWLRRLGIRRHVFHAAPPLFAALTGGAAGLALHRVLAQALPDPSAVVAVAPPALALALYGAAIWCWQRARPEALSLRRFTVAPQHGG